jgi:hypothetical protein
MQLRSACLIMNLLYLAQYSLGSTDSLGVTILLQVDTENAGFGDDASGLSSVWRSGLRS